MDKENTENSSLKVFLGLSSFEMLAMFRRGLFYTYLSIYMISNLGMSVTAASLYSTLPMICSVVSQTFLWGNISDKYQKRRTLIILGEVIAGFLLILVYIIHAQITNLNTAGYVIIFGLSVIEIFWSMSNIGWSALISDLYPDKERSKIMGRLTSLGGLGRMIGVVFGGLLYDLDGTQYEGWGFHEGSLFYLASLIMFLSTLPMLKVPEGGIIQDVTQKPLEFKTQTKHSTSSEYNELNQEYRKWRATKPRVFKIFIILIIGTTFINFGRNSILITYSPYLALDSGFNLDSRTIGYISNLRSIGIIVMGVFLGDLKESRKLGNLVILGAGLTFLGLLFIGTLDLISMMYIATFLMGAGEVIIRSGSYAYVSLLIPPKYRGKLFSYYNAAFFLSWGLANTFITAPLIDHWMKIGIADNIAFQRSFIISALIVLIGIGILFGLGIAQRKSQHD